MLCAGILFVLSASLCFPNFNAFPFFLFYMYGKSYFQGIISAFSQKKGVKRDSIKYARGQNRKAASLDMGKTTSFAYG